jgi:hypothetical protein
MITKYNNFLNELKNTDQIDNLNLKEHNYQLYTKEDFIKVLKTVVNFYYDEFGIEFLGSGAEGNAFKITSKDDSKVLKITTNQQEANGVETVRKFNIRGLVDYYDVREIVDISNIYPVTYSILMENVEPLNNLEKTVWTFLRGFFFDFRNFEKNMYFTVPAYKINFKKFLEDNSLERLEQTYLKYKNHRETKKRGFGIEEIYWVSDIVDHELMMNDKAHDIMLKLYYTFCDLLKDTIKYKLRLVDLHSENLGKDDNGNYKFFDILHKENKILKLKFIEVDLDFSE